MTTLFVAAGGGGDAVGILLARRVLDPESDGPALISTCAWERLRVDPTPGPRAIQGFIGLGAVAGKNVEVLPTSDTDPAGRSMIPRLAGEADARIFLHDFEGGALGLAAQLGHIATSLSVDRLIVVDVGGDVVATGPEANLLSPLADSVTLAAALSLGLPTSLVVVGPGTDGELSEQQVHSRLSSLGGQLCDRIGLEDVERCSGMLAWHPTEASAVVVATALGARGAVDMRRGNHPVPLTLHGCEVWVIPSPRLEQFPIAAGTAKSRSLRQAEREVEHLATNELEYERARAASRRKPEKARSVRDVAIAAQNIGATHITTRRLLEQTRVPDEAIHGFRKDLFRPTGLWEVSALLSVTE